MAKARQTSPQKANVVPIHGHNRADNRAFFEKIFDAHYRELIHLLRRLPINQDDVEDLAQDVLVRVIQQNEPEKLKEKPKAYLYQVAVNLVRDKRRQSVTQKRDHQLDSDHDVDNCQTPISNPEHQVQAEQILVQLKQALDELSIEHQRIFILARFYHFSTNEIAKKVSMPLRSVQRHLRNAVLHCQKKVGYDHEPH